MLDGEPVYRVDTNDGARLWRASTGEPLIIDEARARRLALADQQHGAVLRSATRIDEAPLEYRGKPTPAWRLELADERNTRIYVDATTGKVTARRNDLWRWFDFFWALHIMDYGEREDFNHPLLIGFAALGLLTVVSGGLLWALRVGRRLRHGDRRTSS
jgi:uncharacterized iron-regulated membrane protein